MDRFIEDKVEVIVDQMNKYGKQRVPFLFGFDFELENGFFSSSPDECKHLLFKVPGYSNFKLECKKSELKCSSALEIENFISRGDYQKKFEKVMNGISRGDSYLLNLTLKTPIQLNISFDNIFTYSDSMYSVLFKNRFVCFSPERFVKIENGYIFSNPMKGTMSAEIENALNILSSDYKENCEHNTIVDLIRNDIGIISESVSVPKFKYIDRIKTSYGDIYQMSSEVMGKLKQGYEDNLGNLIFSLLPAGSVSGAPKKSTIRIIKDSEGEKRGYYTGIFGYYDGFSLDSCVLIRYIEAIEDKFFYRSGGGITINSDLDMECEEAFSKIYLPFKDN